MNWHEEPELAERKPVHLLHRLPDRIGMLLGRMRRFERAGWDINGLALICSDAQHWAKACQQEGLEPTASALLELSQRLRQSLAEESLPDGDTGAEWLALTERTLAELPEPPADAPTLQSVPAHLPSLREAMLQMSVEDMLSEATLAEPDIATAPDTELPAEQSDPWGEQVQHFGQSPSVAPAPVPAPTPSPAPAKPVIAAPVVPATATRAATTPARSGSTDAVPLSVPANFRLYHLTAHGPLSVELDQRLEAQGLEIELLEDVEELKELLSALPADLILIDADFSSHLEGLGESVHLARQRFGKRRLLVVAISTADDINLRLSARRAGVDALVVAPQNASDILKRLQALLDPERQDSYRILIVEDDRSQALFAEGILRNAGMESMVVLDALGVMPALDQFHPDMILMDLNMPGANGIELTALIREREEFAHTPIVFLSGESSEDLQFDAIDAGDYIALRSEKEIDDFLKQIHQEVSAELDG